VEESGHRENECSFHEAATRTALCCGCGEVMVRCR
jgi:hypothetical protein